MTIKPTTPVSTPLDTLKALVHRNIDMLGYVSDQLCGGGYDVDEDLLEFIDAIVDMSYAALGEHVSISSEWIGRYNERRIANAGYIYDDGTPIKEHFESKGLTSTYWPRYSGNRDAALAQHYTSVAEMNMRFAEEMKAKAEGREWPDESSAPVEGHVDSETVDA